MLRSIIASLQNVAIQAWQMANLDCFVVYAFSQ